jgi:hypothetical protein
MKPMVDQLSYVQCMVHRRGPCKVKTVKVGLMRGSDEPAEMLLRFDEAQRLRDDLAACLRDLGAPE